LIGAGGTDFSSPGQLERTRKEILKSWKKDALNASGYTGIINLVKCFSCSTTAHIQLVSALLAVSGLLKVHERYLLFSTLYALFSVWIIRESDHLQRLLPVGKLDVFYAGANKLPRSPTRWKFSRGLNLILQVA